MFGRRQIFALLITIAALIALGVSTYLTWVTWQSTSVAGCTGESLLDCDDVLGSRWSKWFGLPVSLLGGLTYLGILGCCWPAASRPGGIAVSSLFALALLAAGSAAWFISLQAIELQSFCSYCLTVHCCGLAVGVLALLLLLDRSGGSDYDQMRSLLGVTAQTEVESPEEPAHHISGAKLLAALGASAVGLSALIGGQLLSAPDDVMAMEEVVLQPLEVASSDEDATNSAVLPNEVVPPDEPADQTDSNKSESASPEFIEPTTIDSLLGAGPRRLTFKAMPDTVDPTSMPLLGNPQAEHVMLEMMDYTCSHCRYLHPHIVAALEKYGDQFSVLVHHVPLSKKCNPHVVRDYPGKKYACDYAQLAIGVWRLAPEKFPEFHDWLLQGEKPPSITSARRRVLNLVGDGILLDKKAQADINKQLGQQGALFRRFKVGLPLMLFQNSSLRGVPDTSEQFLEYLETNLGVTAQ